MAETIFPQGAIAGIMYVIGVDDEQLSEGSGGPQTFIWMDWKWILAESNFWTAKRNILEPFLIRYQSKTSINTEERQLVKQTLDELRAYAGYQAGGHRLLFKIIAFGDNHAWTVANIKLGTPKAKKPAQGNQDAPAITTPETSLKSNVVGGMVFTAKNPATPDSKKLPKGMKFIKFYRYIGSERPKKASDFTFYANGFRGKIVMEFNGIEEGEKKLYCWVYARYEGNKGDLGLPGNWVSGEIMF